MANVIAYYTMCLKKYMETLILPRFPPKIQSDRLTVTSNLLFNGEISASN